MTWMLSALLRPHSASCWTLCCRHVDRCDKPLVLMWTYVLISQPDGLFTFPQGAKFSHQNCATLPAHVKDISKVRKSVSYIISCLKRVEKRHSGLQEDSTQLAAIPANPSPYTSIPLSPRVRPFFFTHAATSTTSTRKCISCKTPTGLPKPQQAKSKDSQYPSPSRLCLIYAQPLLKIPKCILYVQDANWSP